MFDSAAVKNLTAQTRLIGSMHGMLISGDITPADLEDFLGSPLARDELRGLLAAASDEIGVDQALKRAIRAARSGADSYLYVRKIRGRVKSLAENTAEESVRQMLIPVSDPSLG